MENRDCKSENKTNYEQLESNFYQKASFIFGDNWKDMINGIVMPAGIERKADTIEEQEYHNSGHALSFFSMATYAILNGMNLPNSSGNAVNRIVAHLVCLKEFTPTGDYRLSLLIDRLIEVLLIEQPSDKMTWCKFLTQYRILICSFASYYGHRNSKQGKNECFEMCSFRKLQDILSGRHYFKIWWLKPRVRKIMRKVQIFFKESLQNLKRRTLVHA
ncbi:MAG: hypothetical protein A3B72_03730 [Omnitrophica bacterium RIFCSPHIGHO2_02_FULL_45_28]|nr:MAG: hypothetical protein A3B72_03730 [Omnitrophica bacterium RIFCSPHIGHO2_02_FULL_45_28]